MPLPDAKAAGSDRLTFMPCVLSASRIGARKVIVPSEASIHADAPIVMMPDPDGSILS